MSYVFQTQKAFFPLKPVEGDTGPTSIELTNIRLIKRNPQGPFAKPSETLICESTALDDHGVKMFKKNAKKTYGLK